MLELYREKYRDFGPTFACEKLAAEGHELSPDTLTAWLKGAGLWQAAAQARQAPLRRQRRACFGQLVQMDGSEHDWFEGRGGRCVLMVMIDDATSRTLARFYRRENLDGAFDVFGRWASAHGLPRALYVDRAGIYRSGRGPSGEELLANKKPATQFGRAMAELGVGLILASRTSPQAKGRVERRNGLLQDRLVKEMRPAGLGTMEAANAYLDADYLAGLNRDYTLDAADPADGHRAAAGVRLDEVLCEQEQRARSATTGACGGRTATCRSPRSTRRWTWPASGCSSSTSATARSLLEHAGRTLKWAAVPRRPRPRTPEPAIKNNKKWKPPANHPWRSAAHGTTPRRGRHFCLSDRGDSSACVQHRKISARGMRQVGLRF